MIEQKKFDLSSCEKEPIHIPGRIQPYGILIVLEKTELTILQVSTNVASMLGRAPDTLLQQPLSVLLGEAQSRELRKGLQAKDIQYLNPMKLSIETVEKKVMSFDGSIHQIEDLLLLELESVSEAQNFSYWGIYHTLKLIIARLQKAGNLTELCQLAAEEIRELSGYDRVMVYQFDEEWNGTVIAEDKRDDLETFMALRFPASDIPKQARELYEKNWLRMIVDAAYQPVEIVPVENPLTKQPLDLSFAALRSISPIHIEYLKNMGVQGSLSLSLMKEQSLWGMIVCHHTTARQLNYQLRAACELIAQIISTQLPAKEHYENHQYEMQVKTTLARLIRNLQKEESALTSLEKHGRDLLDVVGAQGIVICIERQCTEIGEVPPSSLVKELVAWLRQRPDESLFRTTSLPDLYPGAEAYKNVASGLLALPISKLQGSYVLWFRGEVLQTITWGGDPNVPVEMSEDQQHLHPRRSFEQWKETIRLTSTAWKKCEIMAAVELRSVLMDIALHDLILKQTLGSWLKS